MRGRHLVNQASKQAWQCTGCGRLYIDGNNNELQVFELGSNTAQRNALASRIPHAGPSRPPDA